MLIDIEMALFAVLHIWAYPWQAYSVKNPRMATAESGAGYNLDASEYRGGPLGMNAFVDAFNPWDIIKAIGRGFKWAIVGRKSREQDVSYQPGYQAGTQLQNSSGSKVKMGSYEPLEGEPEDEARYSSSYDPYRARGQAQAAHPSSNGPAPPNGLGPGRMGLGSTEAFAAAPLSRPGNAPPSHTQDGGRFLDAGYSRTDGTRLDGDMKMPEEADFVHAR